NFSKFIKFSFLLKILRYGNEWTLINVFIAIVAIIIVLIILLIIFSAFYFPHPNDICDRWKLISIQTLLRISNEYFGELVHDLFGPRYRNILTRFLLAIPRLFYFFLPIRITIRNEIIANTQVRVYYPKKRYSNAMVLFIHGGGWATLKPVDYDFLIVRFIKRLGMLIISINYRRSPEYRYPIPIDDCEAVYRELVTVDYKRYGIDPTQIFLMGDSAGGNIVAVLAQRQLRANFQKPKSQILIYPVIHPFDFQSPSYQQYYKLFRGYSMLNPRMMAQWYLHYLGIPVTRKNTRKILKNQHIRREGKEADKLRFITEHNLLPINFIDETDEKFEVESEDDYLCDQLSKHAYNPDLAPIMGANLEGLSKAMIITVGYDILRDEGALYVQRLKSFNVSVYWKHYCHLYHGFLNMPFSKEKIKILHDIAIFIELQLRENS
uniref:Alpha/beta hydrolase fold-3 domain-containing protein n=2 Tax=Onchocerca TaxID=6281 RepID=A0A8R1TR62_ONCVO